MKYICHILVILFLALAVVQCDLIRTTEDQTSPDRYDPETLLNNIQLSTRDLFTEASLFGGEFTRMRYMFGDTYGSAYQPQSFDSIYELAYTRIFNDIRNLRETAEIQNLPHHLNVASILQAYTMILLVDFFGDMPYTQTILGLEIISPAIDPAESIYEEALKILDETIERMETEDETGFINTDLFFGSLNNAQAQKAAWIRTANTIKLKAYLNMGNADSFNELVNSGNIILESHHNFKFDYSASTQFAESRHPLFAANYIALGTEYMANNYMNMLLNDKSNHIDRDPRIRYYFYRQWLDDPDPQLKICINTTKPFHFEENDAYCHLDEYYWGRDHLINDGIPPDGGFRTVPGVYPAGGLFDAGQGESVDQNMGYRGAGFQPILISPFTHFMIAEAEYTFNEDIDNARNSLEEAVRQSFQLVKSFGANQADGENDAITQEVIDNYVEIVLNRWDSNPSDRLRNISKEYYLALWPNGYEAYNLMRRTGYPNRADYLQPAARTSSPGNWYRTMLYPASLVNRNSNANQKSSTLVRTFWDTRGNASEFNF